MKKYLWLGLGVVVVVLIGGISFWYYENLSSTPRDNSVVASSSSPKVDAFNSGNFTQAIDIASQTLQNDPKNVNALLSLSAIYAQKGSLEFDENTDGQKAVDYANQALVLDPTNADAYIALGYANEIMRQYPKALAAYTKAISLNSNDADAYSHRGDAYDISGDLRAAETDYLKAASIDPNNFGVEENLGRLYIRKGNTAEAIKEFAAVAAGAPNARLKAEANYNLSNIYLSSTSTDALSIAANYASSSLAADQTYPQAYVALGSVAMVEGDNSSALSDLNKALGIYPNLSYALGLMGDIYTKEGNISKAIQSYEAEKNAAKVDIGLMDNERSRVLFQTNLSEAIAYAGNSQKAEAVNALQKMLDSKPSPMVSAGLLLALADTTKGGKFYNLQSYQPFKDLVKQLVKDINKAISAPTTTVKPQSVTEKVIGFFSPSKVFADVCPGVSIPGGTLQTNRSDVGAASFYFDIYCSVFSYYINSGENYNDPVFQSDLAYVNQLILAVHPSVGLKFDPTHLYLGCGNGVGVWFVPTSCDNNAINYPTCDVCGGSQILVNGICVYPDGPNGPNNGNASTTGNGSSTNNGTGNNTYQSCPVGQCLYKGVCTAARGICSLTTGNLMDSCTGALVRACAAGCSSAGGGSCNAAISSSVIASPTMIQSGRSCNLSWNISNATSCTLNGPGINNYSITLDKNGDSVGSKSGSNLTNSATYTLNCKSSHQDVTTATTCSVVPGLIEN